MHEPRRRVTRIDCVTPIDFQTEVYFLSAAVLYVAFYFIGKKTNEKKANKW